MLYFIAPLGLTRELPDVMSFVYWIDKPKTKSNDRKADSGRRHRSPVHAGDCPERKQKRRIPMLKSFPGEAPKPDSLNVQSGRGHTKPLPDVVSFATGWTRQGQRTSINRRADSAGPHRSPVGAGDCPERKQKRRIPMPKTFPGEAPEIE